jgi:hypothetical protein
VLVVQIHPTFVSIGDAKPPWDGTDIFGARHGWKKSSNVSNCDGSSPLDPAKLRGKCGLLPRLTRKRVVNWILSRQSVSASLERVVAEPSQRRSEKCTTHVESDEWTSAAHWILLSSLSI